MSKKSLQDFNLEELTRIVKNFGAEKRIFNSEAQFQFELAWKIREEFECEVKLEELSRLSNSNSKKADKKEYTDIILEDKNKSFCVAIELKYKTVELEIPTNNIHLKTHGAADLGCYDFMWDVNRIQTLVYSEGKVVLKYPCSKGYAVIITNEPNYWKVCNAKTNTINRDFLLGPKDESDEGCLKRGEHKWYKTDGNPGIPKTISKNSPSRQKSIDLKTDYNFKWEDYVDLEIKKSKFRFMMIEIKKP